MSYPIIIEKNNKIGRIIFNRPERLNSMTPDMMKLLKKAVEELEAEPNIRVIILAGKGKAFSAGADYDFMEKLTKMQTSEIQNDVYKYFTAAVKAVKLCSKPTIAAVHGPAVGGGCEVAIACDFRIASESALFKEVWIKLGLISPLGGMFLLPRLIGLSKATEMLMLGKSVDGSEAERIGLANKCVSDEKFEQEVLELAKQLSYGAPMALTAMKEGLRRGMESTLFTEWETNSFIQAALLSSDDFKEAITAIKESRKTVFKGK